MPFSIRPLALAAVVLALGLPSVRATAAPSRPASPPARETTKVTPAQRAMLEELEHRTFDWFWDSTNPDNGLVPDHYPSPESFASIAAVGFGLTAYGIGAERGWITRDQAVERTLATLHFFATAPQNASEDQASGYHGFFYHFLDRRTGLRQGRWVELSSVDTTLLLGGVLFVQSYFDRDTPDERRIRELADTIYRRVDWTWMQVNKPLISMGWTPGGKFIPHDWRGYNEGMLIYLLALASPTHPVAPAAWQAWTATYPRTWGSYRGQTLLNFAPLFGHQYSHAWVDFRGIRDAWSRDHDLDYFENSRRATYAQRAYAIANPGGWSGYGANVWGLTACNGPGDIVIKHGERSQTFSGYSARGAGLDYVHDDGTLAPTAAAGSIAFAPEIVIPALATMKQRYGKEIYDRYGFVDAFNPSFHARAALRTGRLAEGLGWVDNEQLGIDQGPILLMIENWRSGLVWKVMRGNPYIREGLERAGFRGGWLARPDAGKPRP